MTSILSYINWYTVLLFVIINKPKSLSFKITKLYNLKRDVEQEVTTTTQPPRNIEPLVVESLLVADHSAFRKHKNFINTNDDDLVAMFMKIYYSHVINGVFVENLIF
jgi:hypothetical protein